MHGQQNIKLWGGR